ncbi:hypothetical protein SAMN05444921_11231 [Streptomyces wuyuanensis]|uniref:Uncharacterized protein n=1 Tax=Streptomyces wuyuanensis TaxID=1196353 RepID=A0A1G9VDA8_9ACTN|nr:hypothetical protein SAMN05444921_11231 [Streptomyces wuyuanensis]
MYATIPSAGVVGALDDLVRSLTPAARACVIERLAGRGGVTADEQTLLYAAPTSWCTTGPPSRWCGSGASPSRVTPV